MSTTVTLPAVPATTKANTTRLTLHSYEGLAHRDVSLNPPRDCTDDEVPVIDLAEIDGDLQSRKTIAKNLLSAAENTGFFYIKNHGVPVAITESALSATKKYVSTYNAEEVCVYIKN